MIRSQKDIMAGDVVKFVDGSAILSDGESGGWVIVGEGSDKMYHTRLNSNDTLLSNKAGIPDRDVEWIFNAKDFSIQDMVRLVEEDDYRNSFNKSYVRFDREILLQKLKGICEWLIKLNNYKKNMTFLNKK